MTNMLAHFLDNFPPHLVLPPALLQLADFAQQHPGGYGADFALRDGTTDILTIYFDLDEDMAQRFCVFGDGPAGSLYAFWREEGSSLLTASIAYLDSEGFGNQIMAATFTDFLSLLGTGHTLSPRTRWEDPVAETAELRRFQQWLMTEVGVTVPAHLQQILAVAHPIQARFLTMLQTWQDQHFG